MPIIEKARQNIKKKKKPIIQKMKKLQGIFFLLF